MTNEAPYWIALAHLSRWGNQKINNLIIKFFHEEKITIEEFFILPEQDWSSRFNLNINDITDLQKARNELPNHAFLAEKLMNEGVELISITSADYSKTLKENLKVSHSPSLLYIKGNKQLLQERSVAIVGSREASTNALDFTDNIAKLASKEYKVVVSGFAKGVDKQALDSAIKYKGQSIIVLPQGIMTFQSGFSKYYRQIVDGDVLVLSTFFPKAPWRVELAMARNPIIYGLASEIYVAESSEKGGTWSGVMDGLKKNRKIYVRKPEAKEKNANALLIEKGATPVDFRGTEISEKLYTEKTDHISSVQEPDTMTIDEQILNVFNGKPLTAKEIIEKSRVMWTSKKLTAYLQKLSSIQITKKGRTNYYNLKGDIGVQQKTLFD